ncbi:MAG: protease modulator HflK N-terminal domain-containing protein, partial [Rhodoferax sp.]|nr:protease modulator HflK N-terminal domain-containing protein [Rhodoferax sp.]
MKLYLPLLGWHALRHRFKGMFSLNDSRWGRSDDKSAESGKPEGAAPDDTPPPAPPENNRRPRGQGPHQGPPDLDELWRDFNRKLGGLFGGGRKAGRGNGGGAGPGGFQPDMKSAGIGAGLIAGVVVLIWLGTGFFIVQEGQQAVITQFGKYKETLG